MEPPFICPECHGTRLVYGPCDCIDRFGFHEQGRCPGSWKVRCEACSCDVPGCGEPAQWYVHYDPESKWCAVHGARAEWTKTDA